MQDIHTIYYNSFGIAFQWKRYTGKDFKKIQLVFKNTGLYLTFTELTCLSKLIETILSKPLTCKDCKQNNDCKSFLLETPIHQISFVMSHLELTEIQDLVQGTLFQFGLDTILKKQTIKRN